MITQEEYDILIEGLSLFNKGHFFDCHETLEDVWITNKNTDLGFFCHSVIHLATALYHLEDNNLEGANSQFEKAKEKALKLSDNYQISGIEVQKFTTVILKSSDLLNCKNYSFKIQSK